MKRIPMFALIAVLASAGGAAAQSGTDPQTTGLPKAAEASVTGQANADAHADAAFERMKQDIAARGAKASARARARTEARLEASAKSVDQEAARGDAQVAGRLATEFGTTADAITAEKSSLNTSWGQLMIAHTLAANAKTAVTVEQLIQMQQGGMGWGRIAAGLGLKLGEVVSAVQSEGRVADGQAKAEGKVAVIHGDGARAGAGVGMNGGLGAKGLGVAGNGGIGIKVGH